MKLLFIILIFMAIQPNASPKMIRSGYKNGGVLSSEIFVMLHHLCEVLHCPREEHSNRNDRFLGLMVLLSTPLP